MTGHHSPGLFSESRLSVRSKLEIEGEGRIVRHGVLCVPSDSGKGEVPCLQKDYPITTEEAIAEKALEIGYQPGDTVRYRIIIPPKF